MKIVKKEIIEKTIEDLEIVNKDHIIIYFTDGSYLDIYADSPVDDYSATLRLET